MAPTSFPRRLARASRAAPVTAGAAGGAGPMMTMMAVAAVALAGCEPGAGAETGARQRDPADIDLARGALSRGAAPEATRTASTDGGTPPILVELFTSQGCSSCPPADALLSRLGAGEVFGDPPVIPLAFHVDYWNGLGWADPFSSPRWSERQHAYARRINGRVYTPQLVIHGMADEIGSRRAAVTAQIRKVAREAPPQARLRVSVKPGDRALAVRVDAEVPGPRARALDGWVAVFENGAVTEVARGENAGRRLANDHIVRRLVGFDVPAAQPQADGAVSFTRSVAIALEPQWRADRIGVVVFLQDPDSMRIHGAATVPPAR